MFAMFDHGFNERPDRSSSLISKNILETPKILFQLKSCVEQIWFIHCDGQEVEKRLRQSPVLVCIADLQRQARGT